MYLEKQEITSLIVAIFLVVPLIMFLHFQLIKLNDVALIYSYSSAGIIAIILGWGFRHRITRLFPKKTETVLNSELTEIITTEDNLDDLIHEIELFIKKWKRGIPLVTGRGYRGEIKSKKMCGNRAKIRGHAIAIRKQTNSLKNKISGIETKIINPINDNLDRMVVFGLEVEEFFGLKDTMQESLMIDPNKIERFLSIGDSITQEFKRHIARLEKLRGNLS